MGFYGLGSSTESNSANMDRLLHRFTPPPPSCFMEIPPRSPSDNPIDLEGTTEREGNTQPRSDNQAAVSHDSGDTKPESDSETDRDNRCLSAALG